MESKDLAAAGASVLGEEPMAGKSLAATLRLAAAKGYIENDTTKLNQPTASKGSGSKKIKLEASSYVIEEKREESRRDRRSKFKEIREDDYVPEINLEYTDDEGKKLDTPKEAFRYLCYKFHGKGPGKNKIDKRLKKQELESKAKRALLDTSQPSSISQLISKQKELKSPYIVLSKGK